MSFIDNLRELLTPREEAGYVSGNIDIHKWDFPSNFQPHTAEQEEAARRGSKYVFQDRLGGVGPQGVSVADYDDFVSNRDAFKSMIRDWSNGDTYDSRQNIIDQYVNQYGFNNDIHKDLIKELRQYDSYYNANPIRDGDQMLPYNPFDDAGYRQEYMDWAYENQDYASDRYNPNIRV